MELAGMMISASLQKAEIQGSDKSQKENQEKDTRSNFPQVSQSFLQ
jgi:hypothetical protein